MAEIGVVIVTWNSAKTIEACLNSIPAGEPVAVVDNASSDDTLDRVRAARADALVLAQDANLGFGAACNVGAAALGARDILLLNPDAELARNTIERLRAALASSPEVGVVGPAIHDAEGDIELSWGADPTLLWEWRRARAHAKGEVVAPEGGAVDWVTGGCCAIRRETWEAIGGFDAGFFLYFEDLDLCRRARGAGYQVVFLPEATARHVRGVSARQLGTRTERHYRTSQLYYYRKHASWAELLGLRAYLAIKYAAKALRTPRHASIYLEVLAAVFRGA
ncbi:MAG TPA: glycosyltransferase family 2 protein [Pantanalinema sp.]